MWTGLTGFSRSVTRQISGISYTGRACTVRSTGHALMREELNDILAEYILLNHSFQDNCQLHKFHNQQYSIVNPILGKFAYQIPHSLFISKIVLEMVGVVVLQ